MNTVEAAVQVIYDDDVDDVPHEQMVHHDTHELSEKLEWQMRQKFSPTFSSVRSKAYYLWQFIWYSCANSTARIVNVIVLLSCRFAWKFMFNYIAVAIV